MLSHLTSNLTLTSIISVDGRKNIDPTTSSSFSSMDIDGHQDVIVNSQGNLTQCEHKDCIDYLTQLMQELIKGKMLRFTIAEQWCAWLFVQGEEIHPSKEYDACGSHQNVKTVVDLPPHTRL